MAPPGFGSAELIILGYFWIAFVASLVVAWPVYRLLVRLKSQQIIDPYAPEEHQRKHGTPTMGGLIIVVGFVVSAVVFIAQAQEGASPDLSLRLIQAALVLFVGFALIGFADDFIVPRLVKGKRGLGWKQKIVAEFAMAGIGAGMASGWSIDLRFGLIAFLVLFFSNAYNFADGLDGLAGSILVCLGIGIAGLAWAFDGNLTSATIAMAMVGATIPFLFLNAPPAKVFMGDVGSLGIGAVLGLLIGAMATGYPDSDSRLAEPVSLAHWKSLTVISLLMVAELVPVPMQVAWYKLTKKRLFPMTPIHHAFEKKGWKETKVVASFGLVQLLLSLAALTIAFQRGLD